MLVNQLEADEQTGRAGETVQRKQSGGRGPMGRCRPGTQHARTDVDTDRCVALTQPAWFFDVLQVLRVNSMPFSIKSIFSRTETRAQLELILSALIQ